MSHDIAIKFEKNTSFISYAISVLCGIRKVIVGNDNLVKKEPIQKEELIHECQTIQRPVLRDLITAGTSSDHIKSPPTPPRRPYRQYQRYSINESQNRHRVDYEDSFQFLNQLNDLKSNQYYGEEQTKYGDMKTQQDQHQSLSVSKFQTNPQLSYVNQNMTSFKHETDIVVSDFSLNAKIDSEPLNPTTRLADRSTSSTPIDLVVQSDQSSPTSKNGRNNYAKFNKLKVQNSNSFSYLNISSDTESSKLSSVPLSVLLQRRIESERNGVIHLSDEFFSDALSTPSKFDANFVKHKETPELCKVISNERNPIRISKMTSRSRKPTTERKTPNLKSTRSTLQTRSCQVPKSHRVTELQHNVNVPKTNVTTKSRDVTDSINDSNFISPASGDTATTTAPTYSLKIPLKHKIQAEESVEKHPELPMESIEIDKRAQSGTTVVVVPQKHNRSANVDPITYCSKNSSSHSYLGQKSITDNSNRKITAISEKRNNIDVVEGSSSSIQFSLLESLDKSINEAQESKDKRTSTSTVLEPSKSRRKTKREKRMSQRTNPESCNDVSLQTLLSVKVEQTRKLKMSCDNETSNKGKPQKTRKQSQFTSTSEKRQRKSGGYYSETPTERFAHAGVSKSQSAQEYSNFFKSIPIQPDPFKFDRKIRDRLNNEVGSMQVRLDKAGTSHSVHLPSMIQPLQQIQQNISNSQRNYANGQQNLPCIQGHNPSVTFSSRQANQAAVVVMNTTSPTFPQTPSSVQGSFAVQASISSSSSTNVKPISKVRSSVVAAKTVEKTGATVSTSICECSDPMETTQRVYNTFVVPSASSSGSVVESRMTPPPSPKQIDPVESLIKVKTSAILHGNIISDEPATSELTKSHIISKSASITEPVYSIMKEPAETNRAVENSIGSANHRGKSTIRTMDDEIVNLQKDPLRFYSSPSSNSSSTYGSALPVTSLVVTPVKTSVSADPLLVPVPERTKKLFSTLIPIHTLLSEPMSKPFIKSATDSDVEINKETTQRPESESDIKERVYQVQPSPSSSKIVALNPQMTGSDEPSGAEQFSNALWQVQSQTLAISERIGMASVNTDNVGIIGLTSEVPNEIINLTSEIPNMNLSVSKENGETDSPTKVRSDIGEQSPLTVSKPCIAFNRSTCNRREGQRVADLSYFHQPRTSMESNLQVRSRRGSFGDLLSSPIKYLEQSDRLQTPNAFPSTSSNARSKTAVTKEVPVVSSSTLPAVKKNLTDNMKSSPDDIVVEAGFESKTGPNQKETPNWDKQPPRRLTRSTNKQAEFYFISEHSNRMSKLPNISTAINLVKNHLVDPDEDQDYFRRFDMDSNGESSGDEMDEVQEQYDCRPREVDKNPKEILYSRRQEYDQRRTEFTTNGKIQISSNSLRILSSDTED